MGICSNKSSYYNFLEKNIKKEFDLNYSSEFNKAYSLRKSRFINSKKVKKYIKININNFPDWKSYLLSKLVTNNYKSWRNTLYNLIISENYLNQYNFQNELFFQEFSLLNFPSSVFIGKNNKFEFETILFPFDGDELSRCSTASLSSDINNKKNYEIKNEESQHLNIELPNETMNSKNGNNIQSENKYNINQIKKYLIIILKQLKNKFHPITFIIKEFSEVFVSYINDNINIIQNGDYDKFKIKIIKEVQYFIEIMQVVLKLFYIKSINYHFFISERDEFINLITYILFNQKKDKEYQFYNSLYKIFKYSNEIKARKLDEKIKLIGEITPEDAGVSPKFCLNKQSEEFFNKYKNEKNYENNMNIYSKSKIANYLKNNDIQNSNNIINEKENLIIDFDDNIDNEEINEINIDKNIFNRKKFNKRKFSSNTENNNEEDNKIQEISSSITYEEFANKYNTYSEKDELIEKIEEDIDFIPTGISPEILRESNNINNNNNSNIINDIPYKKAIEYIKTLKYYKVPLEKLTVIALTSIIITKSVDEFWIKEKNFLNKKILTIDADELMSIYLYIVYNMKEYNIFTELDFIDNFITSASKQSMVGYYYTTVIGCINYILKVNNKDSLGKN